MQWAYENGTDPRRPSSGLLAPEVPCVNPLRIHRRSMENVILYGIDSS